MEDWELLLDGKKNKRNKKKYEQTKLEAEGVTFIIIYQTTNK